MGLMNEVTAELDRLVERLESGTSGSGASDPGASGVKAGAAVTGDAIDRELARGRRSSAVASLRQSEVVRRFRQELVDGLVRADTVNQLLRLVGTVLEGWVAIKG